MVTPDADGITEIKRSESRAVQRIALGAYEVAFERLGIEPTVENVLKCMVPRGTAIVGYSPQLKRDVMAPSHAIATRQAETWGPNQLEKALEGRLYVKSLLI